MGNDLNEKENWFDLQRRLNYEGFSARFQLARV